MTKWIGSILAWRHCFRACEEINSNADVVQSDFTWRSFDDIRAELNYKYSSAKTDRDTHNAHHKLPPSLSLSLSFCALSPFLRFFLTFVLGRASYRRLIHNHWAFRKDQMPSTLCRTLLLQQFVHKSSSNIFNYSFGKVQTKSLTS